MSAPLNSITENPFLLYEESTKRVKEVRATILLNDFYTKDSGVGTRKKNYYNNSCILYYDVSGMSETIAIIFRLKIHK